MCRHGNTWKFSFAEKDASKSERDDNTETASASFCGAVVCTQALKSFGMNKYVM
jgi:hypothetical protein